jgi:hypothetical protein
MIKFGMGNTLLTFLDKYYEYSGNRDVEDRGLTISGYESAWLTDLCMEYIMDNSRDILEDLIYDGIYRDDGIAVFKGSKTTGKIANCLSIFQYRVNNLAGSEFLEFTTEVWGNNKDNGRKHKAVNVTNKHYLTEITQPCIHMCDGLFICQLYLLPDLLEEMDCKEDTPLMLPFALFVSLSQLIIVI